MNYRGNLKKITVSGIEVPVPNHGDIFMLHDYVGGNGNPDGMIDVGTNAIYQVSTGKTFRIVAIGIISKVTAAGDTVTIYEGATEDAATSSKLVISQPIMANDVEYWIYCEKTIASGKFITYDPSGTTTDNIRMIGYEY